METRLWAMMPARLRGDCIVCAQGMSFPNLSLEQVEGFLLELLHEPWLAANSSPSAAL